MDMDLAVLQDLLKQSGASDEMRKSMTAAFESRTKAEVDANKFTAALEAMQAAVARGNDDNMRKAISAKDAEIDVLTKGLTTISEAQAAQTAAISGALSALGEQLSTLTAAVNGTAALGTKVDEMTKAVSSFGSQTVSTPAVTAAAVVVPAPGDGQATVEAPSENVAEPSLEEKVALQHQVSDALRKGLASGKLTANQRSDYLQGLTRLAAHTHPLAVAASCGLKIGE